jgi:hypothetical protein
MFSNDSIRFVRRVDQSVPIPDFPVACQPTRTMAWEITRENNGKGGCVRGVTIGCVWQHSQMFPPDGD